MSDTSEPHPPAPGPDQGNAPTATDPQGIDPQGIDPQATDPEGTALQDADPAANALDAHGYDPADYDWVPVLRKPRADGWTPQRQVAFIGVLADSGSVTMAADAVGMTRSGAYALRRAPGGEAFSAAWDAAIHQAARALIDVAFDRAFNGSDEPVYSRDGKVVGRKHRQCDGMIMFLLRKHFPDQYGDLHRDRADRTPPPAAPSVAQTLVALEPVRPADPLAHADPDDAAMLLDMADDGDGKLPSFYRQDGSVELEQAEQLHAGMGPDFEARLARLNRMLHPDEYEDEDDGAQDDGAYDGRRPAGRAGGPSPERRGRRGRR